MEKKRAAREHSSTTMPKLPAVYRKSDVVATQKTLFYNMSKSIVPVTKSSIHKKYTKPTKILQFLGIKGNFELVLRITARLLHCLSHENLTLQSSMKKLLPIKPSNSLIFKLLSDLPNRYVKTCQKRTFAASNSATLNYLKTIARGIVLLRPRKKQTT